MRFIIKDYNSKQDRQRWEQVRRSFDVAPVNLGSHWSYNLAMDPKRLAFVLSRYKFAARMAPPGGRVLELGCSEGIGAPILAENAISYTGVDLDRMAVQDAQANWSDERFTFVAGDFLDNTFGLFDLVVSMDVVEHISPEQENHFFETLHANMALEGICVVGTPNVASQPYASEASRRGHVNLFDGLRLRRALSRICHNVFLFSMNDEMIHTGFEPMAHFLLALGCNRKEALSP